MMKCLLLYNGERVDPLSNTFHLGNGYRTLNPLHRQFLSPDSISPFGAGGINPYSYCLGDPVNRADPSGHISWQAITGIVTGVIGIALVPFTLGQSLTVASCIIAGIEIVSGITAIAAGALEERDPEASEALGWVSLSTGILSLGFVANKTVRSLSRLTEHVSRIKNTGLSGRGAVEAGKRMAINRSSSMNELQSLYRVDQRAPRTIMSVGFTGTRTDPAMHVFATFENNTVFTSKSLSAVDRYVHIQQAAFSAGRANHGLDLNGHFYLYRINPSGLNALDFKAQYAARGDKFIEWIARTSEKRLLGTDEFWDMVYEAHHNKIKRGFVGGDEVHLEGPISPDRITPIFPSELNYLDLAY